LAEHGDIALQHVLRKTVEGFKLFGTLTQEATKDGFVECAVIRADADEAAQFFGIETVIDLRCGGGICRAEAGNP
jgi:hypothetical protein